MRFVIPALLVLLSPVLAVAQQNGATQETSTLRANANLVLLDVVVSAGHGGVKGISKDKFHVYDDGKPQSLTVFEEHDAGDSGTVERVDLGPNVYSNQPEVETKSANILLFDTLNTPIADQTYVRQEMLRYIRTIPSGTRIAIFTLASRLRMVEDFTSDPAVLSRAIEAKGDTVQLSNVLDPQFTQQETNAVNAVASFGADVSSMQQFLLDQASFEMDQRVSMTMDAMQQLARYLQPIPGRKNLIWFSGSFPIQIMNDGSTPHAFNAIRDYSDQLRETDTMLSAARVAVYPVDARGPIIQQSGLASSDFSSTSLQTPLGSGTRGSHNASAPATGGYAAARADDRQLVGTMNEQGSMQQIAEETGGRAFTNTNGIRQAVAEATTAGAHYYTVGYVPRVKQEDGSYHRLKVTVDGEGEVAYRHGYYSGVAAKAPAATSELTLMRAAVEPNSPPMSEVLFKVHVVRAPAGTPAKPGATDGSADTKQLVRFELDYAVPATPLAFSTSDKGEHHDTLEFVAVAFDEAGHRLNYVDQRAPVDVDDATFARIMRSGIVLHQRIDLPPGRIVLRIVVHDVDGNRAGALQVPLVVAGSM